MDRSANKEPKVFHFHHNSFVFGEYELKFIVEELEHTYRIKITNDLMNNERSFEVVESYIENIDEYINKINNAIQKSEDQIIDRLG